MSVSPISSLSSLIYSTAQTSPPSSIQEDLTELADALQSGDLQGAQQAYANLEELRASQSTASSSAPVGSGTSGGAAGGSTTNPITADFAALGQALSTGNLGQAQNAFTQLTNAIQTAQQAASGSTAGINGAQGHRHHRHHGGDSAISASASAGNSTAGSAGSSIHPSGNSTGTVNLLG